MFQMYASTLELLSHVPTRFGQKYLAAQIELMERCERTQVNEIDSVLVRVHNGGWVKSYHFD